MGKIYLQHPKKRENPILEEILHSEGDGITYHRKFTPVLMMMEVLK
jgi:hypothetical protein